MKKLYIVTTFVSVIVLLSMFLLRSYFFTSIKFSSSHPNIGITKKESISFSLYANLFLNVRSRNIRGVKPRLIGIIYTDKIRQDNRVFIDGSEYDFGSTIDINEGNEVLIFIYVSQNALDNKNFEKLIKNYTVDTIAYYQDKKTGMFTSVFSNLAKLPIYVKDN